MQIASELERLLLRDYPAQAAFVRDLGESVADGDLATAKRLFSSLEMWGGAGSVADINLMPPIANERLNELLVQLAEQFENAGITYPRATMWAGIFKKWQADGVFRK